MGYFSNLDAAGSLNITLGVDASGWMQELTKAEVSVSALAGKAKDRLMTVASSLGALRKEATQVKEALAGAVDFRVRGDAALDVLHGQLGKVREAGSATDKTLDSLSLTFEQASRGAKTYTQALDKVAADKNASEAVRNLARALSDEAKEANLSTIALERRQTALNRQLNRQRRTFVSTLRQADREENPPAAAEKDPHLVPQQAAASATARLIEGQASIRAGERFLTGTLGLGPALQSIFPLVGGLAFVGMLDELVDRAQRAYEALKKIQEAPQRINQEFRDLNAPLRAANDELDLTNAKLENEIAKLSGKPENSLKEALAETRVEADKVADALDHDFQQLAKVLSENKVGFLQSQLTGEARTDDLSKEFGNGASAFLGTGAPGRVRAITDAADAKLDAIQPGTTKEERQEAIRQRNQVRTETRAALEKENSDQVGAIDKAILAAQKLQKQTTTPLQHPFVPLVGQAELGSRAADEFQQGHYGNAALHELAAAVPVVGPGLVSATDDILGSALPDPQARRLAELRGTRRFLMEQRHSITSRYQNEDDTEKLTGLRQGADAAALTRPYQDKIKELDAQLRGLKNELASIGQSSSAETLAKSWAKAQEEIARLNNELAKHHQALSLEQQVEITTLFDQQSSTQAEIEWKTKLDQTTTSIQDRIASLRLLASAIGAGYEAQKKANVETQLFQVLGKDKDKLNDPQWLAQKDPVTGMTHGAQVTQLRASIGAEIDASHDQQSAESVDKLKDQIQLERSLAAAQRDGAAALRLVTLAYRLRNLAMQGASQEQIKSEVALFDAQRQNQSAGNLTKIQEEISATERLSAAQLQGAEEYRQAQLQLKYGQMQREGASPQEIASTKTLDSLQHQQQVTAEAIRTGFSYQNQLQSIDQQVAALQQVRAQQGDSLAIETSLRSLELERSRILTEQVMLVGSAKDGMAAFFREMATEGQSAASQIHDEFKAAFEGINDNLSRLMTGQKTNWASFLQSLGQQISKMSLQNLEHQIAAKIVTPKTPGILAGPIAQRTAPGQSAATKGGFAGFLGKILGPGSDTGKRDGNTPASALFVTMVGANGIPQWNSSQQQDQTPGPSSLVTPPFFPYPVQLPNLQQAKPEQPRASMQTLQNGAATKPPGFGSVLLHSAIQIGAGLATAGITSAAGGNGGNASSDSGGSQSGSLPDAPGSSVSGTGPNAGMDLTRLPSGLILRQPEGGAYAAGGRPPVGKLSLVGEKGPELFVPDRPGTIIPNHKLSSALTGGSRPGKNSMDALSAALGDKKFGGFRAAGGSVDPSNAYVVGENGVEGFAALSSSSSNSTATYANQSQNVYYTIDARGTDPMLAEQRVGMAIRAAHSSAVVTSTQVQAERAKRTPQK
jgi:hypothetical protein